MNEIKTTPAKTQDTTSPYTLSSLSIALSIPDSNSLLAAKFHAVLSPSWKKYYRLDWTFGDSVGVISKFDTSGLDHYYAHYGSYLVTLSVFDTVSKLLLGKTSLFMDLINNAIDTNYLHLFKNVIMVFSGVGQYDTGRNVFDLTLSKFQRSVFSKLTIEWSKNSVKLNGAISWNDTIKYFPTNPSSWVLLQRG